MTDPNRKTAAYAILMFGILGPSIIVATLYGLDTRPSDLGDAAPIVWGTGLLLSVFCAVIGSNMLVDSDEDE